VEPQTWRYSSGKGRRHAGHGRRREVSALTIMRPQNIMRRNKRVSYKIVDASMGCDNIFAFFFLSFPSVGL